MATEEQTDVRIYTADITAGQSYGQRLTISNRTVSKLSFYLEKAESPSGVVTFLIRQLDDTILASKAWGLSIDISTTPAWYEVTLDSPILINEEVFILATADGGGGVNKIKTYSSYPDSVKASEWMVGRSPEGVYTDPSYEAGVDFGYIYTYDEAAPTVTTQAVTSISGTTATGNGNVTDLGDTAVTQHGHCWNTTGIPTTSDDKTENGAVAATGAFTSSLTGLTPKILYYVRAYATNTAGTSYGGQVAFIAGALVPGEGSGIYAVVEERFHYVDAYGVERYVEGMIV